MSEFSVNIQEIFSDIPNFILYLFYGSPSILTSNAGAYFVIATNENGCFQKRNQ